MKTYTIRYYEPKVGADAKGMTVASILDKIYDLPNHVGLLRSAGQNKLFVKINSINKEKTEYQCFFVRYRDELPIVMNTKSQVEKPPHLEIDEELVEKNHFSLFLTEAGAEFIAYQVSMEGANPSSLATYLSFANDFQEAVSFSEVVKTDSYARILAGDSLVKSVEFEVAKPRSRSFVPDPNDTWTKESIEFMSKTGGTRFRGKVMTRTQNKGLVVAVKDSIKLLMESNMTKKLKVKLSDVAEPIDLFTDRIFDKISVPIVKGWPNSDQVFKEIRLSFYNNKDLIDYLVEDDEALDLN